MDTAWKTTDLTSIPSVPPSTVGLRPNTPMEYEPTRAVAEAQDGVAAGCRRILATWGLGGATGFHVPAFGEPSVEVSTYGTYPDRDSWRSVASLRIPELFPGCCLRVRVVHCGSGQTQVEGPSGTWSPAGPFGAVRVRHTWTAADASTAGPIDEDVELPPSPLADAAVSTEEAGYWHAQQVVELELRPDDLEDDATAAVWSERAAIELELQLRGSPRIVALVVYESPVRTSYAHDDSDPHAVNGQTAAETPQTLAPQVEAADGATYEEHRFGTTALAFTATRQSELGPAILSLLAWDEATATHASDVEPLSVSSPTFVNLLDPTVASYDPDRPGYVVAAAHAQQHHLCDRELVLGGNTAVVPARVVVRGYLTGAAVEGVVRVQSGPYEWIDVVIASVVPTTTEATGYLESQATPDHASAVLQCFARVNPTDTLEIESVTVLFGE